MKIMYVIPNIDIGGVSTIVNSLALGMTDNRHDVMIVALNKYENKILELEKIKIIELNICNKKMIFSGVLKLIKLINCERPDIVHSHTVYSHLFVRAASLFCGGVKYIASEHTTMDEKLSHGSGFRLMKASNFLSDLITNVSESSVQSYFKYNIVSNGKMLCVYNGIDLKKFEKSEPKNKISKILFVGRICKEKNLPLLIDLMKDLSKKGCVCDIIGQGDLLDEIKLHALNQNVHNVVNFLGQRLDIPKIMKNYDILILPSITEGLPTVLIEAIASKILVLSTDCGGVREILDNYNYLIAKNNNKDDLLKKFLNLEKMDLNLIINDLYNSVNSRFSMQNMISAWEDIYQNILK